MSAAESPSVALERYQQSEPVISRDLVERAAAVQVVDQATAEKAAALRDEVAAVRKGIEEAIEPHIANAHKTHKALCEERRRQTTPFLTVEHVISGRITAWQIDERKRQEAEARAAAFEAQKQAAAEAKRREEELRAAGMKRDDAREIARSEVESEVYGKQVAAERVAAPAVAGSTLREPWVGEVMDVRALCRAIADGVPGATVDLIEIKGGPLNRLAQATQGSLKIPGVVFRRQAKSVRTGRGR